MKFILNKDTFVIDDTETINSGSVNYYEADVEYDESWEKLAMVAVIIKNGEEEGNQIAVINNKIFLDREKHGRFKIGFIGYTLENEQKIYQVSTNLESFCLQQGAGSIEVVEGDIPTPSEWEIYVAQIQEMVDSVNSIPSGGTTGQVLAKKSNKDYDYEWRNQTGGTGGTPDYSQIPNKPSINEVELVGDKSLDDLGIQPKGNYLEVEKDPTVPTHVKNIKEQDISNWNNKSNFSGYYNDLTNVPDNIAKTDENNNFNKSQTINGTLTVNGDIVQNGESYETHAEKVYTENDEIITREGAVGALSEGEYTGIQAQKYDGQNNGRLGFNASGEARVGDIGDEQPLLTRDEVENLTDGQLLKWDGTQLKAVGTSEYQKSTELEEKELLITYEDGTTETIKLVVYK